ncbi:type II toxin-antitoxin system RelE/ParE family toxin [Brucella gallinifaecis]|uniref:type II toxin-antitoxin system RelE/ParE family toxin n=1 Tax=Brucella gallinifaecis TaxID=215590 RepID=UPI0023626F3F|nr:type II toxin-antitoxin system RelE/ParE family toxin [Brucella gallinifaecis]
MITIKLSKLSADFVRREGAYLRQYSVPAAQKFAYAIKSAKTTLQRFPESGNRMHGLTIRGGRTLVAGDYLIDYLFDGKQIEITNIRHGRTVMLTPDIDDDYDDE